MSQPQDFAGRVALITGASRGIGAAITLAAAKLGHQVIAVGRNQAALAQQWQAFPNVSCEAIDVAKADQWERLLAKLEQGGQQIDVLINVAGVLHSGPTGQLSPQQVDEMIDVNVKGTVYSVQACLEALTRSGAGRVVITSSITGPVTGFPGWSHYGASKAAQLGFMRTAAIELAAKHITVNAVLPGNILTEGLQEMGEDYIAGMARSIPAMGRQIKGELRAFKRG